jgi:hypothetical protein
MQGEIIKRRKKKNIFLMNLFKKDEVEVAKSVIRSQKEFFSVCEKEATCRSAAKSEKRKGACNNNKNNNNLTHTIV